MRVPTESTWVWMRRLLGVGGFIYALTVQPDLPLFCYAILGGLLGLPDIVLYQRYLNRERTNQEDRTSE